LLFLQAMAVKRSISFKFSSSILSIVLIIMVIMMYYNYRVSRDLVLDNASRDVKNLTQSTINQIDNVFESIENIPEEFTRLLENPEIQRVDAKKSLMALIKRVKLLYGSSVAWEPAVVGKDTIYNAPYMVIQYYLKILARTPISIIFKIGTQFLKCLINRFGLNHILIREAVTG